MTTCVLATFWTSMIAIIFVTVSFLLIGVVLLQKNRGSGLSGAFGGVGGHSAFGTKTGDVLTWFTVGVTGVFLLLAILGNYAFDMGHPKKAESPSASESAPPVGTETPVPPPAPAPQPAAGGTPGMGATATPPGSSGTATPAGGNVTGASPSTGNQTPPPAGGNAPSPAPPKTDTPSNPGAESPNPPPGT